ncbi:Spermidine synthase [Sphaceloma murrayae]|uniref:Spermidine synthase n=1 Tax=Sphaceloma murrayae TaxID=2082308 RepID=A0A2K1QQE2_9PEZI|nr:Spermidine synthase [Sphaceloma murrayae]
MLSLLAMGPEQQTGSSSTTSAFNVAFQTDLPSSLLIKQNGMYRQRFQGSMKALSETSFMSVGGGNGALARSITARLPERSVVVQDLDQVIANARRLPENEAVSNLRFESQDILQPNSSKDPAAFIVRIVLYNFPKEDIVQILRRLSAAMKPGFTRLIISEVIMPGVEGDPMSQYLAALDLTMLAMFNGRERSLKEWKDLVAEADSSLTMVDALRPANSAIGQMIILKKP